MDGCIQSISCGNFRGPVDTEKYKKNIKCDKRVLTELSQMTCTVDSIVRYLAQKG